MSAQTVEIVTGLVCDSCKRETDPADSGQFEDEEDARREYEDYGWRVYAWPVPLTTACGVRDLCPACAGGIPRKRNRRCVGVVLRASELYGRLEKAML
jgi:hypothetical protein